MQRQEAINELISNRVIMAPMAGICTSAYCEILRRCGCRVAYTGLLTCHGLVRFNRKTLDMIAPMPGGMDIVAQIFGADPETMAAAAEILEHTGMFKAIDINMGCPAPKVLKTSGGAALMKNPELAGNIVAAVSSSIKLPVTVKIRAGIDASSINYLEVARICEDNGAAAIALHPRTRAQGFSGMSDWTKIARLKETVSVPVIGSGDIQTAGDAARMMRETGCDAVMIGRACYGDPWLIARAQTLIKTGVEPPPPPVPERIDIALQHIALHIHNEGEKRGIFEVRKFIPWYLRGLPGASTARAAANCAGTLGEVEQIIREFGRGLCTNDE